MAVEGGNSDFFTRLRKLCRDVDQSMGPLKESLSLPPRNAPHLYDRGLNLLQKDVRNLKAVNDEATKTQRSVQNFSNWLHSMQEVVDEKAEDILKMEKYLAKFGYVPMEKPASPISNSETTVKQDISCNKDKESGSEKLEVKLQAATGLSLVKEDDQRKKEKGPIQDVSSKQSKNKPSSVEYQNMNDAGSYGSNSLTIEQWLKGVESCNVEVTPDVVKVKSLPKNEKQKKYDISHDGGKVSKFVVPESVPDDSEISDSVEVSQTPAKNPNNMPSTINVCNTPVEPELSEYTTRILKSFALNATRAKTSSQGQDLQSICVPNSTGNIKKQHDFEELNNIPSQEGKYTQNMFTKMDTTPEKQMPSYQALNHVTKAEVDHKTPEEPVLSHYSESVVAKNVDTKIPEEPVLSIQQLEENKSDKSDFPTPEEPTLSYQFYDAKSASSVIDKKTPEEPVLSGYKSAMQNSSNPLSCLPASPELSDITMSLLSLQNKKGSQVCPADRHHDTMKSELLEENKSVKNDYGTPEEPTLSYQFYNTKFATSVTDKTTPEEPVLSGYASAMRNSSNSQSCLDSRRDIPASPELSDITMSLLSLQNKKVSQVYQTDKQYDSRKSEQSYESSKCQFSRNGKLISNNDREREMVIPYSNENVPAIEPRRLNQFRMDALPPSPQLSEATKKLLSRLY